MTVAVPLSPLSVSLPYHSSSGSVFVADEGGQKSIFFWCTDSSLINKKVKLYLQEGRVAAVSRIPKHRLEIFTRSEIKKKCKKITF